MAEHPKDGSPALSYDTVGELLDRLETLRTSAKAASDALHARREDHDDENVWLVQAEPTEGDSSRGTTAAIAMAAGLAQNNPYDSHIERIPRPVIHNPTTLRFPARETGPGRRAIETTKSLLTGVAAFAEEMTRLLAGDAPQMPKPTRTVDDKTTNSWFYHDGIETRTAMGYEFVFPRTGEGKYRPNRDMRHDRLLAQPQGGPTQEFAIPDRNTRLTDTLATIGIRFISRTGAVLDNMAAVPASERWNVVRCALQAFDTATVEIGKALDRQPAQGQYTLFDEASNDERDRLLEHLLAGKTATLHRVEPRHHSDTLRHDPWAWRAEIDQKPADESPPESTEGVAALRLLDAGIATVESSGETRKISLSKTWKRQPWSRRPRDTATDFSTFEHTCRHRRYHSYDDCRHERNSSSYCGIDVCPLVETIYEQEQPKFSETDPAFIDTQSNRATPVVPVHSNTLRSKAWKEATTEAVERIVHICRRAGRITENGHYLAGPGEMKAAFDAIAEGRIEKVRDMPGLGIIIKTRQQTTARPAPTAEISNHQS